MERMEQMYTLQTQLDFGKVKVGSPRGRLLCPAMPTARLARTPPSSQTTPPRGSPPGRQGSTRQAQRARGLAPSSRLDGPSLAAGMHLLGSPGAGPHQQLQAWPTGDRGLTSVCLSRSPSR